jgi:cyanophycinase-like exopeptidase
LLVIMGSGEMGPRMRRVHASVVSRLAGRGGSSASVKAVFVDTTYGFQENAAALSEAGLAFLAGLGVSASLAPFRREDGVARETALARIRAADLVFSGPGSPSYALRQWSGTPFPDALAAKLADGGAVVFASAAALCLGRYTVPVYEIYKGGADPHWLPGLDVLAVLGLDAAVIPHWNNSEGAGFDTRYCWLGERRLAALERQLTPATSILGVDEHTALWIDADAGRVAVHGRGSVTVRRAGASRVIAAGEELSLDELRPTGTPAPTSPARAARHAGARRDARSDDEELAERIIALERDAASTADRARLVAPLVEALLELRAHAREMAAFDVADGIRDRLVALGIEIADAPDGPTTYRIRDA